MKRKQETQAAPEHYLSMSGGKYRVIAGGYQPCSADKDTAAEAIQAASRFNLTLSDQMWNGDTGQFVPLQAA